jgi:hypothetical protein
MGIAPTLSSPAGGRADVDGNDQERSECRAKRGAREIAVARFLHGVSS